MKLLFVSRVTGVKSDLGLHVEIHADTARRLISDAAFEWSIPGYTLTDSVGLWEGCREPGFIIWLLDTGEVQAGGFAECIRGKLQQKSVLYVELDVLQAVDVNGGKGD